MFICQELKKADKITTDAIRFKRIPQRMCEVCGKVITEENLSS